MKKWDTFTAILLIAASTQSMHASLVAIENMEHFKNVANAQTPTVFIFSAEWCGACSNLKEPLQKLVVDPTYKQITFAQIDIDAHRDIAQQENIDAVPTLRFNKGGEQLNEIKGLPDNAQETIGAEIDKIFNPKKAGHSNDAPIMQIMQEQPKQPALPEQKDVPQTPIMNVVKQLLNGLIEILVLVKKLVFIVIDLVKNIFGSVSSFFAVTKS